MKKIEQNKKQKRERILKAAQEIFQSSGSICASMDKVAEKACVTKHVIAGNQGHHLCRKRTTPTCGG